MKETGLLELVETSGDFRLFAYWRNVWTAISYKNLSENFVGGGVGAGGGGAGPPPPPPPPPAHPRRWF